MSSVSTGNNNRSRISLRNDINEVKAACIMWIRIFTGAEKYYGMVLMVLTMGATIFATFNLSDTVGVEVSSSTSFWIKIIMAGSTYFLSFLKCAQYVSDYKHYRDLWGDMVVDIGELDLSSPAVLTNLERKVQTLVKNNPDLPYLIYFMYRKEILDMMDLRYNGNDSHPGIINHNLGVPNTLPLINNNLAGSSIPLTNTPINNFNNVIGPTSFAGGENNTSPS